MEHIPIHNSNIVGTHTYKLCKRRKFYPERDETKLTGKGIPLLQQKKEAEQNLKNHFSYLSEHLSLECSKRSISRTPSQQ
ncbi:hypothetical protein GYH30_051261 [Glycine max]|uniref:Uncharacterized protein n=1 Tax=Glycine max TaxID=3847 RepID=A0A0R0F4N3_SOYBN|nr:hypothetical protein GYH30_051261 [Glycine max]